MNQKVSFCITFLLLLSNLTFANERLLLVTKKTTLRAEATSIAVKVTRLAVNDTLVFQNQCDGHYCKVSFNGQIGWVKKKCYRNLYPPPIPKKNKTDSVELVPPPPMKIEMEEDTEAWDDLPIKDDVLAEDNATQEDIFQRIQAMKSAETKTVATNSYQDNYQESIDAADDWRDDYDNDDDDFEEGESGSGGAGYFLILIMAVIGFNVIRRM